MNKWAVGIVIAVFILTGLIYAIYEDHDYDFNDAKKEYTILKTWELPSELKEVSGLTWAGDETIACVQDEEGIIYFYDLKTSKIQDTVHFAGTGDFEAITKLGGHYWVIESTGRLYKIPRDSSETTQSIQLEFEYRNNVEGLTASKDNTLWFSVKERNLDNEDGYKGFYAYNPETVELDQNPVMKILYSDPAFKVMQTDNPRKLIRPSDLAFHPSTGDVYVLDAEFQKIVITEKSTGKIKKIFLLDPVEFTQPEGICFSPSGRLFISNEANGTIPNIVEIELENY